MSALWCLCLVALAEVPAVQVKGNLIQSEPGTIRVELLLEQGPGQHPLLAHVVMLDKPGPFTFEVPAGLGTVKLRAGLDRDGDGLGPTDPQLVTPVRLDLDAPVVEGVRLEIIPSGR
jgi:hypothetical protein